VLSSNILLFGQLVHSGIGVVVYAHDPEFSLYHAHLDNSSIVALSL
jgi:hypothetical protein